MSGSWASAPPSRQNPLPVCSPFYLQAWARLKSPAPNFAIRCNCCVVGSAFFFDSTSDGGCGHVQAGWRGPGKKKTCAMSGGLCARAIERCPCCSEEKKTGAALPQYWRSSTAVASSLFASMRPCPPPDLFDITQGISVLLPPLRLLIFLHPAAPPQEGPRRREPADVSGS